MLIRALYPSALQGVRLTASVRDDFRMHLDLDDAVQRTIYLFGVYEPALYDFLRARLSPGAVFVDVGANVGQFTLLGCARGATVHAVEAAPENAEAVRANLALNGFAATVHPIALTDQAGTVSFYLYRKTGIDANAGMHSLGPRDGAEPIMVPADTFDARFAGLSRLDLLKIDVEGADYLVLRGAEQSIQRHRPIIACEADEPQANRMGYSTTDLKAYLRGLGYAVHRLTRRGLAPIADEPEHATTLIALPH